MAVNASKLEGARALDAALARDHDGSIFGNLGLLSNFGGGDGVAILGHVLGGWQPQVASTIAKKSGLSLDKVIPRLITVAPLVMGALGKLKNEEDGRRRCGHDPEQGDPVRPEEGQERHPRLGDRDARRSPSTGGGGGGLGDLLSGLGGLFGKKKK